MTKKLMLLALAAFSASLFALPAIASAEVWHVTTAEKFTASGGTATLTVKPNEAGEEVNEITCTENTASGEYENTTTGKNLTITFHKCHVVGFPEEGFGSAPCTTSGQPTGTIKTTDLTFHNIMVEAGQPAILITPKEGHFASFTCSIFGLPVPITVNGNGIIGEVEKKCGETSKTAGLNFTSSATGVQTWKQVTTAGTVFDLTSTSGGVTRTASEDATGTISFANSQTINCTP